MKKTLIDEENIDEYVYVIVPVIDIWAIGAIVATSLYGWSKDIWSTSSAIPPFWKAVSIETATI